MASQQGRTSVTPSNINCDDAPSVIEKLIEYLAKLVYSALVCGAYLFVSLVHLRSAAWAENWPYWLNVVVGLLFLHPFVGTHFVMFYTRGTLPWIFLTVLLIYIYILLA